MVPKGSSRIAAALALAASFTMMGLAPAGAAAQGGAAAEKQRELDQEKARVGIYKAWFPNRALARRAAISFHAELLEAHYKAGYLVLELEGADIARLQSFGFRIEPATDFIARRDRFLEQLKSIDQARSKRGAVGARATIQSIPNYSCYETVEETFAAAQVLATARPDLARWIDIGDSWQKSVGSGGYDLRVLKISNTAVPGPKPKLFVQAAIHAREYTTAPLVLEFARWLVNGYGSVADATWIVDHHEVHLLLQANPDGRKKAESGLSWRKNTNTAYCGPNSNNRGADLNRNFSFGWNSTNGQGSSGNACDLTYRGPSAGSEPEVQAIQAYARSLWPDQRGPNPGDAAPADTSGIHLDIHSYSQLVLWPWGTTSAPTGNATALQTLGRKFAWFNGYTPQQSIGLYPTDGTSDGASYGELGVAAYTFELGTSFFQSCSTYNNTIKPNNLPALVYAAKVVRTPYLTPAGPDVTSVTLSDSAATTGVQAGIPVTLSASATDLRFNNSNGTEGTQNIAAAEATIGVPPWDSAAVPIPLSASDGSFNAKTEALSGELSTSGLTQGRHLLYVRARDAAGNWGAVTASYLTIVDAPPPIGISLAAGGTASRPWVRVNWSGASGSRVDIRRNGALILNTPNDGTQRLNTPHGTWRFQVCQAGSQTACSSEATITM